VVIEKTVIFVGCESLHNFTILQILSITLFEKVPSLHAVAATDCIKPQGYNHNQLKLFDF